MTHDCYVFSSGSVATCLVSRSLPDLQCRTLKPCDQNWNGLTRWSIIDSHLVNNPYWLIIGDIHYPFVVGLSNICRTVDSGLKYTTNCENLTKRENDLETIIICLKMKTSSGRQPTRASPQCFKTK